MKLKKSFVLLLTFSFLFQSLAVPIEMVWAVKNGKDDFKKEVKIEAKNEVLGYSKLMREFNAVKTIDVESVQPLRKSNVLQLKQKNQQVQKTKYAKKELEVVFDAFIDTEEEKLKKLNIAEEKQTRYLQRLEKQKRKLSGTGKLVVDDTERIAEMQEIQIPHKPSSFKFQNEKIKIKSILPKKNDSFFQRTLKKVSFWKIPETKADYLLTEFPEIGDLQSDEEEVELTSEIYDLAEKLEHNPVKIINFVRNFVNYEPYYGAKKGALGCLHEGVCNDTDATSLTIALMRASGIPARYKKDLIQLPVSQLQNLLGVEATKTVYASLDWNKVPVYLVSGNDLGDDFATADFSQETHLALEWTYPEIFYEQDYRGGNFTNMTILTGSGIETTDALRNELMAYPQKQWISLNPMLKQYANTHNEIVADSANFNTESFWKNFLQYQGEFSPLEKYADDLFTQTGKDLNLAQYQSTKNLIEEDFQILPPALPCEIISNTEYPTETWTILPNNKKHKITLSLVNASGATVLSYELNASEANNTAIDLFYEGATETDQNTIESYGGIHATPAELVEIKPFLRLNHAKLTASQNVKIGDTLVLKFDYVLNGENLETSEKFSVAGNNEGIYMTFSRIETNTFLDDSTDENRYSKILLEGNAEIARQYLLRMQENGDFLEKVLDLDYNLNFARAVVTQNRVLNKIDGVPTTFDFKGLTIDAHSYIQDYSRIGNWDNHREDFHLLWGLQASYDEAQIFEEIAGLDSISTVQGLRYAYANPNDYTIYEIDSNNESVIDSLTDLSANTRADMHAEVQAGKTVITPDDFVSSGSWYGIFYIVLNADGSARYAIGEQVLGNGGWTIRFNAEVIEVTDQSSGIVKIRFKQENSTGENVFVFAEDENGESKQCFLTQTKFQEILTGSGYDLLQYGVPCMKLPKTFGGTEHLAILTTDGVKFYSAGKYDYWRPEWWVKAILQNDLSNAGLENAVLDMTFKFNPIAGTYSYTGSYDDGDEVLTAYYEPNADDDNRGKGWVVYGDVLEKLEDDYYEPLSEAENCDEDDYYCKKGMYQWVLNGVGFPMGNREEAYDENGNVVGNKQQFRGGGIYSYERLFGISTYYSPDPIFTYHQEQGAETGDYGFPISDPISFSTDVVDQNKIYQDFENGRVEFLKTKGNLPNNASEMQATFTLISPYLIDASEEYEEGFRDHLFESGINVTVNLATGVFASKVFTKILSYIVKKYPKKVLKSVAVKYIPVVGWGILIYSATVSLLDVEELHTACESGSYYPLNVPDHEQASHKYFCGKRDAALILGAIGFTSDRALSALKAKNILGVKGNVARSGKEKLMSFVSDNDMDSFENILSGNPKRRTQFFDDVDGLDEGSLKLLAQDKTILKRLTNDGEVEFYGKIKLNGVKTAEDANRKWSGYNPLPYPENTNILEFEINNSMTDEFVRLHNDSNPNRPWIMRKSDFLFYQDKNTGKINLDTIKQDYQIPNENLIDTVSGYLPQEGDILHEGMINGGISNKLQYEIIMDGNVPIDRFTENTILTNLLP